MSDYTKDEQAEFERLRSEFVGFTAGFGPFADHYAIVAHFTLRKLREERGYDFRAAKARKLRMRLAQIDRDVMLKDDSPRD